MLRKTGVHFSASRAKGGPVHADQRPLVQRPQPRNTRSDDDRDAIPTICNYAEFSSLPPSRIVPKLAGQGHCLASDSSFYRILRAQGQHHRGRANPPVRREAANPFQGRRALRGLDPGVRRWRGVTGIKLSGGQFEALNPWLPGPVAGMFFCLCLIVDIFSRKILGREVHEREGADLAAMLVQKAVWPEACIARPLGLHADPGFRMGAARCGVQRGK